MSTSSRNTAPLNAESAALCFPSDPWQVLEVGHSPAFELELEVMLEERLKFHGAARDMLALERFLGTHLRPGKVLVHGAGSHSAHLLERLAKLPHVQVVGLVDKWAGRLKESHGHALVLPAGVPELIEAGQVDYVLLSSPLWEMQMQSALLDAGVPKDCIQPIYADPSYAELALACNAHLIDALPQQCERVLLDFARQGQSLIDEGDLARLLDPKKTLRLFSERFEQLGDQDCMPSFGFRNSLALLQQMLERLQPRVVYLRTFTDDSFLSCFVSRVLPGAKLLHEAYDFAITIAPEFLREGYGHSARSIQMAYSGEAHSFRNADYVIGKRGGPLWERVTRGHAAPYASYFAQLPSAAGSTPRRRWSAPLPGEDLKLIYAGNLPSEEVIELEMASRLLPLFKELSEAGGLKISLFNGAHRTQAEDAQFAYVQRALGSRVPYSAAIPYADILEEMQGNHYGWLYVPRDGIEFIDEQVLVSNRFTGYVCAGLPVILDDGWDCMAALVREFDAGIVVSMAHPERLLEALRGADVERHRRGALALREHMRTSNAGVLRALARCIAA